MTELKHGNENYRIVLSDEMDDERVQYILKRMREYNDRHSEYFRLLRDFEQAWKPLSVFLTDAEGNLLGGIIAHTNRAWGWMSIAHLWLDETVRKRGLGAGLIKQAEEEALRRGCAHVEVQTWSFQAPEFYRQLGYQVVGQLDDNPPGLTRYWFRKDLVQSAK